MFRRSENRPAETRETPERVDSVLGAGIAWQGDVSGTGGLRIDGAFDGDITLRGLVVIGEQGRVTCRQITAITVIIAGSVKGNITANRVEIGRKGRVWGDLVTTTFSTEEGAFLRGKITMEEEITLELGPEPAPELDQGEVDAEPEGEAAIDSGA